jgi:hypothetical protein
MNTLSKAVRRALAVLAFACAHAPLAHAQFALSFTSVGTNSFLDGNSRMIGWQFTVTEPIAVSQLGWFDWNTDGLARSHEIGIWDTADQSLITSVVIPSGTGAALAGSFRYATLGAPALLLTGRTYRIAGFDIGASGDPHVWDAALGGYPNYEVSGFAADSRITLTAGNALGALASGFGYPTGPIGDTRSVLMGPNFVISSVPEPSTVVLLLIGAGGIATAYRRRKSERLRRRGH